MKTLALTILALFLSLTFPQAEEPTAQPAGARNSTIGKIITGTTLHRFDGESFSEATMAKAPQFYLLYYSASW
ncbi:MAG: hypothetical protein P1U89_17555 [Verrucomicrobiales bacterium]|nr:hypothetical protein [Verrucomicrobiales bacterium]